jgi:hypothetical protein
MYSDVMMYDDVASQLPEGFNPTGFNPEGYKLPNHMGEGILAGAMLGNDNTQLYTHVLFKIDECYKIIINRKDVIDMHKIVYGDNISYDYVNLDPLMNSFKITDEYGFFVNDNYDIDMIRKTIDDCYKQVVQFKKVFSQVEDNRVHLNNFDALKLEPTDVKYHMRKPKFSHLRDNDLIYKADDLNEYKDNPFRKPGKKVYGNVNNKSKLHFKTIKKEVRNNTLICFNKYFYNVVLLSEKDISEADLYDVFPELKLVQSLFIENDTIKNDIVERIMHMTEIDIINENINNVMNNYSDTKKWPEKPTFDSIKTYIQSVYKITSYVEDKIQFSIILDRVCKEMHYYVDEKRAIANKILPLVLKDLGLNKKRYAQGVFWYGLIEEKAIAPSKLKPVKNFDIRIKKDGTEEYTTEFNLKVDRINEMDCISQMEKYMNDRKAFNDELTPESYIYTSATMVESDDPADDLNLCRITLPRPPPCFGMQFIGPK